MSKFLAPKHFKRCLFFGPERNENQNFRSLLQGHTETIFDCSFKPEDSDLLATGSFDGSIKIWRVDTMEAVSLFLSTRSRDFV